MANPSEQQLQIPAAPISHRSWADNQIIERSDRVGLRPKPNSSRRKPAVVMIDEKLIIQPALGVITLGSDAQFVPLAKRRALTRAPVI